MGSKIKPTIGSGSRPQGRPRRLEIEQVLDVALEIGLEELTMSRLAERLGVAKAVLYGYVDSREELVQLAAARASMRHAFPEDENQPLTDYILEHARALLELMVGDAQLVTTFMNGGAGPAVGAERVEIWLRALTRRGFSGEEALLLYQAMNTIVLGAAVSFTHLRSLRTAGTSHAIQARKAILNRSNDLPLLHEHLKAYASDSSFLNWEYILILVLHGTASARNVLADEASKRRSDKPGLGLTKSTRRRLRGS